MAINTSFGLDITQSYSRHERTNSNWSLVDPGLRDVVDADHFRWQSCSQPATHQIRRFLGEGFQNDSKSSSPWNGHAGVSWSVSPPSNGHERYVSSEASLSVPWDSPCGSSRQSGLDQDVLTDASSPGDGGYAITLGEPSYPSEGLVSPELLSGMSPGRGAHDLPLTGFSFNSYEEHTQAMSGWGWQSDIGYTGSFLSGTPGMTTDLSRTESPAMDTSSPMAHSPEKYDLSPALSHVAPPEKNSPPTHHARRGSRSSRRSSTKRVEKPQNRSQQKRFQKTLAASANPGFRCQHCTAAFHDEIALEKHIRTLHTRPFTCVFHYAGCNSKFAAKNEWKRHVLSQHLYLDYYHCNFKGCATSKSPSHRRRSNTLPQIGGIFNRKDLYTQHVRRMHQPDDMDKRSSTDWEAEVKDMQKAAQHRRCNLPQQMGCPAVNCNKNFHGEKAWDDRMEHVARHLELAASGREPPVYFGGDHDLSLTLWAESPEVDVVRREGGTWRLNNPVKGDGSGTNASTTSTLEEDAEGEEI